MALVTRTPASRLARHWQVLLVVTAGAFLANLDLFIVNIALPAIQADFAGSSLSALSWVLSGYAIVFAALLVPAGRLADLLGRKRLFL
ncbi:MAG: MFS transporter, partial [Actinomycetota bacterium]